MEYFLTTKELTHLRYLADSLAARPDKSERMLNILLKVITSNKSGRFFKARKLNDSFVLLIKQLSKDIGISPTFAKIKSVGKKYSKSKNNNIRRTGEILLWATNNREKKYSLE